MLIGILSDTHGLLRQEVIDGLEGVDHMGCANIQSSIREQGRICG